MRNLPFILGLIAFAVIGGGAVYLKATAPVPPPDITAATIPIATARYAREVKDMGPGAAFASFKREMAGASPNTAHSYSHLFGRALYESAGVSGVTACDGSFNYGCFHGFFIAAVAEGGLAVVPSLDAACAKTGAGYLPCQHGIGHGILEFLGHERLAEALKECARLPRPSPVGGCTSGVFMEYNSPISINDNGAVTTGVRAFDPKNPYEPCRSVAAGFRLSCYHELPGWWTAAFSQDYTRAGKMCGAITDADEKTACIEGFALTVATYVKYDVSRIAQLCDALPGNAATCRESAARAVQEEGGNAAGAATLCAPLSAEEKQLCMSL